MATQAAEINGAPSAPAALAGSADLPERLGYRLKRRALGPPLTTDQIEHETLSKKLALGVLSSDCISSSAYGSEEILLILIPMFGLAAYTLLLPMTLVVLVVLLLVTLCYRQVVMLYTKAGGSYVVARENFGPVVAQVAAVALMVDYIVTVAVQSAAGTNAVTSAIPALVPYNLEITVAVVLILFYGNLRGLREAGRTFAFPTYFFAGSMFVVIIGGIVREVLGDLPQYDPAHAAGAFPMGHSTTLLSFGAIYILLKSFANGGSSLTGLEAISNGVSTFKTPRGLNARKTLVVMSCILGFLVAGVSWLAHQTHAVAYVSGSPTVISQVAKAVLGDSAAGHAGFLLVQLATMLILYTGANTPFNGFPFLANFVAADGFLPRWMTKRGHRLAFSNGIVVLTVASLALLLGTGAHVDRLVAFYAIGVFTGFTLAGFGMAKHFRTFRGPGWKSKVVLNNVVGAVSGLVVLIFAVTKFTEGAWLVVLIFPIMVIVLLRLHRAYDREAELLEAVPSAQPVVRAARSVVVVLVDSVDLAVIRAIRYAHTLRPSELHVVHFVIDSSHAAELRRAWDAQPGLDLSLEVVDCPDRRLPRAALELTERLVAESASTQVTMLLPRRSYGAFLGRMLHDRTADDIAAAVSTVPGAVATIVPYDATKPTTLLRRGGSGRGPQVGTGEGAMSPGEEEALRETVVRPPAEATDQGNRVAIQNATHRQTAVVQGRIRSVQVSPISGSPALRCELVDETGGVTLLFYGRRSIAGIEPGVQLRAEGRIGTYKGHLAIANPLYSLMPRERAET
ncbi:MAG TPA: amino acid permease [Dermatophilaceae bacterium]|nr:amino acid permease [Dermatophilaceae bacterium]